MKKKYTIFLLIASSIILLDQLTKELITQTFLLHENREIIPGFFNLTYIRNTGGAFGLLSGKTSVLRTGLFLAVSCAAMVMILCLHHKTPAGKPWLDAALAMTLGGAAGNLIDRIRTGDVVDFLDFYVGARHWPAFNIADSAITIGVGIFCFYLLFKKV